MLNHLLQLKIAMSLSVDTAIYYKIGNGNYAPNVNK
ncbi:hypothetical protein IX324_002954 [Bacteroides pyogenes]|nr:hypothetical protein [Bacteroides pyogenes]